FFKRIPACENDLSFNENEEKNSLMIPIPFLKMMSPSQKIEESTWMANLFFEIGKLPDIG
ncbi:MAG: hypothetical protein ACKOKF_05055, partial [Bacteroidota bacterium]